MGARRTGQDRHFNQLDVRRVDAGACLSALPRRRAHSVRDRKRRARLTGRHPVRPAAGARARLQPAGAVVELHEPLARRPLVAARHRLVSDRGRVRAPQPCGAQPRTLADQLLHGRNARSPWVARMAVRVRDPGAPGLRGAQRAAEDLAPRRCRNPNGDTVVHGPGPAPCRGNVRRRAAAAVRGVRQDAARAATLS